MQRRSFNSGWTVAPRKSPYDEFIARHSADLPKPRPVTLPHDAVRELARDPDCENGSHTGYFPGGNFRYEKEFTLADDLDRQTVVIEFEGVYRDAMVYINGDLAGQRPSGFTGFSVLADPYLRAGQPNRIVVECRSMQDARWYVGAGIYRDVWIASADLIHVPLDGVQVSAASVEDGTALVAIATTLRNDSRATCTVRCNTRVIAPDGEQVAQASAPVTLLGGISAVSRVRLPVTDARLWRLDDPALYRVETELICDGKLRDRDVTSFGIRTITVDALRGLRINGEPVKLRGACIHHDNGPLGAAAISRADERRVELLQAAGFNAIRAGHSPISRATLDAADRLGMLVIDEFTDVWTEAKNGSDYSLAFAEWWERDLAELVRKDFNHPSVLMYSIGNETFETGSPIGSTWARRLAERLRELDPTRPIANAISPAVAVFERLSGMLAPSGDDDPAASSAAHGLSKMVASKMASSAIEESAAAVDVVAFNYSEARYGLDAEKYPNRVIVGGESLPGQIDELWPLVCSHRHVIGDFTWTGWDYLGEAGLARIDYTDEPGYRYNGFNAAYPALTAQTGDLDITGRRRTISYYREIVYGLRETPYIAVHRPQHYGRPTRASRWSWSDTISSWSWNIATGSPIRVDVYSPGDEVELRLDDESLGRQTIGSEKAFVATFDTTYRPGLLTAVSYRDGREIGRAQISSALGPAHLTLASDRAEIVAGTSDLAFVAIELRDSEGVLNTAVERLVTVTVDGAGTLAGLASARPATEESFCAGRVTTYDGCALAVIRPIAAGEVTVTVAAADGLRATLSLQAVQ